MDSSKLGLTLYKQSSWLQSPQRLYGLLELSDIGEDRPFDMK